MITFFTALYPEAKGLIDRLCLKKQPTETLYQLFEGNDIRLVITGAGMIPAATVAARHFTKYPSTSGQDIVINLGVAGFARETGSATAVGDLFLVSKITEQPTGRTFYPDLLYRHSFSLHPLVTLPNVCKTTSAFWEETLLDMEASALYQALLPHISPDRMFFFKVVSDILGEPDQETIFPDKLLAPHFEAILNFAEQLHTFLAATSFQEPALTDKEFTLSSAILDRLPMTEAMSRDYKRLIRFAKLADKPLADLLQNFLDTLEPASIRGKKQAMPYFSLLQESIINEEVSNTCTISCQLKQPPAVWALYQSFFATVYAEKEVWNENWQNRLHTAPILIDHYKDIFNRSHQDFARQKKAPSLILAKKTGTLIYQGAPVCQNFGNEHFYYTSCMMNCIYHCDYCYLQGMYPSGHVVVFVNLEDYFNELELLLKKHPVYLCVSYDTDLLALEQTFSFVGQWLKFAAEHSSLTLEIRTKSGNAGIFEKLAAIYQAKPQLQKNIIFAWTVSPEHISQNTEHGAASLHLRLQALLAAKNAGFSIRLCFDPMIFHAGWKRSYSTLVDKVFSIVPPDSLYDVSIGVFRISNEYLKNMRKKRPDNAIAQYPYVTEKGVSHYGPLSEEMIHYLQELLLQHLPSEKIFVWKEEGESE